MAFIGEAIVPKILNKLATLASNEIKQEIRLVVGVEDEIKKLTKNFESIQALLSDAERKQWKEESIRLWLEELKEVSYEMDDVLDEWRSVMLIRLQADEEDHVTSSSGHTKSKLSAFIPSWCFSQGELGLRHDIAHKIKDLNARLEDIAIRKNNYGLISIPESGVGHQQINRNTISYVDITEVKGRAKDEEKIVNMLLTPSDGAANPHVISIVGMGGLGKTTLAQLVCNNTSVEEHFDKILWVCVSDPFDEIKVGNAILKSLDRPGESVQQNIVQNIKKETGGKRFLLVLDNVWNEDPNNWKNLKVALSYGLPGSMILVTTRKERVSMIMGCEESSIFRPGHLSKEECWSIIRGEVALSGMAMEELEMLEDIGYQIADNCKGLPLATKALGGVLRFKVSREEWETVLNSEIWKLEEDEIDRDLFAPLLLSYYDLSAGERQCLSYCAIFLKDSLLEKKELIELWMAQGYLPETSAKTMEMKGEEYFRNLCARSLFQDFKKGSNGKIKACKMHDIVHDFVQLVSKTESSCVLIEESRFDSFRHLYFYCLPTIHSFRRLRTLMIQWSYNLDLCCLFKELRCVRSLGLIDCGIREIPSTIGRLIHLRLLDLRRNHFCELPQSICDLCNLLILDLRDCDQLMELPLGIEKLSKLRYLRDDIRIKLTKENSRSLNALRKASFLVDGKTTSMANLKSFNHLKYVHIFLRRSEDVGWAREAGLNEMKHLASLKLIIDNEDTEEEEEEDEEGDKQVKAKRRILHDEELFEALQLPSNLEKLTIQAYLGAKLCPSWLLSLNHLRIVKFNYWDNCSYFPPLGKLPSLTNLELSGHECVRKVSLEFLGFEFDGNCHEISPSFVAFPKLKHLQFGAMKDWEEWDMDVEPHLTIMPCLTYLSIGYCRRLKALPDHLLRNTKLKTLQIFKSHLLYERYQENGVDRSKISHIPNIDLDDD